MQTISLGNNSIQVPALGIGTWAWGDKIFWSYGSNYGSEDVKTAFEATLKGGVNFFDTAEIYGFGESETLIGKFIKQTNQPVIIATKYAPFPWRWNGQSVSEALTDSLKRLQMEQVHLYQVHFPFTFLLSQETLLNTLADEVQRGRILTVGVSNYSAEQMREAHEILGKRGIPLAVNQVQYSLVHRNIETNGVLDTARELGVKIIAYSPLSQGLLSGKYTPDSPKAKTGARQLDPRFSKYGLEKISPVLNLLQKFGEKYNKTPAQVALNWLIAQGDVIPIPGAKNALQAEQNTGALGWSLSTEEIAQLAEVSRPWLN